MPERGELHSENYIPHNDPVTQRIQALTDNGDQAKMERIAHLLRTDPFADLPGEEPDTTDGDQAAISRMVSEGGPEIAGK